MSPMPLSLDEVEDLIDSWELDPDVDTVGPAAELFVTMAVGDPGRLDVLTWGGVDAALALLDRLAPPRTTTLRS